MMRRKNETIDKEPTNVEEETFEPIEITQILPILNLIPLGMFLASICLMMEIFKKKKKSKNKLIQVR